MYVIHVLVISYGTSPPPQTPPPSPIEVEVADKDSGLVIMSKGAGNCFQSSEIVMSFIIRTYFITLKCKTGLIPRREGLPVCQ